MAVTNTKVRAVAAWLEAEAAAYEAAVPFVGEQLGHREGVAATYRAAAETLRSAAWFAPPSLLSRLTGR